MMTKEKYFSWNSFHSMPLVGIMRNISRNDMIDILPLYYNSGLTTIEVTMNSPGWETIIRFAAENFADRLNIGAGTVCTENDLELALSAGAQFIVTPVINFNVIELCRQSGVPVFPGAYTPTEIYSAWKAGADMVKLFPAIANGLEYMKAVKAPFPEIKLLPTGGVDLRNCAAFLQTGASGVGIGSQLFDSNRIATKNWGSLAAHFTSFAQQVRSIVRA